MVQTGRLSRVRLHRGNEQTVVSAGFILSDNQVAGFREPRVVEHQRESLGDAIGRAAAPVGPLVVARAEAVVERAVGQQEFEVVNHTRFVEINLVLVLGQNRVAQQQRHRFLQVVTDINRAAALVGQKVERLALAVEQTVFIKVIAAEALPVVSLVEIALVAGDFPRERELTGGSGKVVDVRVELSK